MKWLNHRGKNDIGFYRGNTAIFLRSTGTVYEFLCCYVIVVVSSFPTHYFRIENCCTVQKAMMRWVVYYFFQLSNKIWIYQIRMLLGWVFDLWSRARSLSLWRFFILKSNFFTLTWKCRWYHVADLITDPFELFYQVWRPFFDQKVPEDSCLYTLNTGFSWAKQLCNGTADSNSHLSLKQSVLSQPFLP